MGRSGSIYSPQEHPITNLSSSLVPTLMEVALPRNPRPLQQQPVTPHTPLKIDLMYLFRTRMEVVLPHSH